MKDLFFFLIITSSSFVYSKNMTFEECNVMASELNKLAPYQADEVTIFERASCTSYPTELIFNYKFTVSALPIDVDFVFLKDNILSGWCYDQGYLDILKSVVGVEYRYRDVNRTYLGDIWFSINEC